MATRKAKPTGVLRSRYHLHRLKRAAKLRETGALADAEYGAILCDVAFRIRSDPSPLSHHLRGFDVDGMTVGLHLRGALDRLRIDKPQEGMFDFPPAYGPVLNGPEFVRMTRGFTPGSMRFEWDLEHDALLETAIRKASPIAPVERHLATVRARYPHVSGLSAALLASLFSFFLGTCFGARR